MNKFLLLILLFLSISLNYSFAQTIDKNNKKQADFVLVIHGGAGTITKEKLSAEKEKAYKAKMEEALRAGYDILNKGGSSLEAIEAVIKILEDSPLFNAGKGAVLNYDGKTELDASIMDGKTLMAGAVAGVTTIKNPITAAKAVMLKSPHVMMTGKGAEDFAKTQGIETVDPEYFKVDEIYKKWQKLKAKADSSGQGSIFNVADSEKFGTVGAVALDKNGNLAAGTSTGGMMLKKFGRVGDSPIIGAGTYADNNTCAVSCTGHGEYFIRYAAAHDVSALMAYKNYSVKKAAEEVIAKIDAAGGKGGLITLDKNGNFSMPFSTEGMFRGYIKADGSFEVLMYK